MQSSETCEAGKSGLEPKWRKKIQGGYRIRLVMELWSSEDDTTERCNPRNDGEEREIHRREIQSGKRDLD